MILYPAERPTKKKLADLTRPVRTLITLLLTDNLKPPGGTSVGTGDGCSILGAPPFSAFQGARVRPPTTWLGHDETVIAGCSISLFGLAGGGFGTIRQPGDFGRLPQLSIFRVYKNQAGNGY